MLNTTKTQFFLPIPPASQVIMFLIAVCLATVVAFVQHRQISKPKAKTTFVTEQSVNKQLNARISYTQTESLLPNPTR